MFEKRLLKRESESNLRQLVDFASNDYLGLSRKFGATGSRLLTGNSKLAEELETAIAAFHGYETGLIFNCGYMANLGLLSAVAESDDTIIYDAHVHASTKDGIALSRAKAFPFRHNDLEHLEKRLKRNCFVCVESIYSTDGSKAPLREICSLVSRYGAHLIVDEAHAVGVYGPEGRGLVAEQGLMPHVFAQVVTFGKALGTFGAIVLGSRRLTQGLLNFSRPFIYTTALPYPILAAIKRSYELFPKLELERQQLRALSEFFQNESVIQAVTIPGNGAVKEASKKLLERGFDVRPLLSPTVQRGKECLRICLHAFNTQTQVLELTRWLTSLQESEQMSEKQSSQLY